MHVSIPTAVVPLFRLIRLPAMVVDVDYFSRGLYRLPDAFWNRMVPANGSGPSVPLFSPVPPDPATSARVYWPHTVRYPWLRVTFRSQVGLHCHFTVANVRVVVPGTVVSSANWRLSQRFAVVVAHQGQ